MVLWDYTDATILKVLIYGYVVIILLCVSFTVTTGHQLWCANLQLCPEVRKSFQEALFGFEQRLVVCVRYSYPD